MVYREPEEVRLLKERTRSAIDLAKEGRWEDAAQLNREILEADPDNVAALNRLGKALVEMNRLDDALEAFRTTLLLEPGNAIAAKHVARLNWAAETGASPQTSSDSAPGIRARMFTGDSGKSAEVVLLGSVHAGHPSPGAGVSLADDGASLLALDADGACLGIVPPKVARRLIALMAGGNRYDGAVSGQTGDAVRVVIRETYQHPAQRARVSFPPEEAAPADAPRSRAAAGADDALPASAEADLLADLDESRVLELAGVAAAVDDLLPPDLFADDLD